MPLSNPDSNVEKGYALWIRRWRLKTRYHGMVLQQLTDESKIRYIRSWEKKDARFQPWKAKEDRFLLDIWGKGRPGLATLNASSNGESIRHQTISTWRWDLMIPHPWKTKISNWGADAGKTFAAPISALTWPSLMSEKCQNQQQPRLCNDDRQFSMIQLL